MSNRGWKSRLAATLTSDRLFDEGVEAARIACAAGASIAAAAMTAAAWYSNPFTGIPALRGCMQIVGALPMDLEAWQRALRRRPRAHEDTSKYAPGFGFVGASQAKRLRHACGMLAGAHGSSAHRTRTIFFAKHAPEICRHSGPLNHAGLAALQFIDHGITEEEGERWYLLCRLEAAIAEAQRARSRGLAAFPFLQHEYVYEGDWPEPRPLDVDALRRRVGIDETSP